MSVGLKLKIHAFTCQPPQLTFYCTMGNPKLRSRIETRAKVIFPWLSAPKSVAALRRAATKTPCTCSVSSLWNSTSSLSIDQFVAEQPVVSRCRCTELGQGRSLEQPAIHSTPQLPKPHPLGQIDCEKILDSHFSKYEAEQHSVPLLRQATSLPPHETASDRVFATTELLEMIL